MSPGTQQPHGRFAETSSRGVLVTLARKGARRFLTADLEAAADVKLLQLGAVGEDGDVTWHTEQPRGRFAETSSRGVLVTLASKGARRFLTADRFAFPGVKLLQLGAVGEDGDVTWHTAAARKVRGNVVKGGTGYPSQQGCAKGPSPRILVQPLTKNFSSLGQLARTATSPGTQNSRT